MSLTAIQLLNPHGSDETEFRASLTKTKIELLNPHGSDETKMIFFVKRISVIFLTHTVQMKLSESHYRSHIVIVLLNPHGSDETINPEEQFYFHPIFLTHTVQMKRL